MRWVVWISLLGATVSALAQSGTYPLIDPSFTWVSMQDTSLQGRAGAYSWLEAGSGSVPSALVNEFLRAGRIESSLKNTALDKLTEENRAALQWRQGAWLQQDNQEKGWWIRGENQTSVGINFSRDLYQLALFGNASFAGDTASLSGSFVQDNHNLLEVGGLRRWELGGGTIMAAPFLALKQGYSGQIAEINGFVYTAEDGSFLDLDASGYWFRTDSNYVRPVTWRGLGANAGLWVTYQQGAWSLGARYTWHSSINWSAFSPNFTGNIQRRWTGWDITELFGGNGGDPLAIDSLTTYLDTVFTSPVLPDQHNAILFVSRDAGKWGISAGANLTTENWRSQQVYLQLSRRLGASPLYLSGHMSYGGLSVFNAGLHIRGNLLPQLYMIAGTQHVLSLMLPREVPGTSYFVQLAWQW